MRFFSVGKNSVRFVRTELFDYSELFKMSIMNFAPSLKPLIKSSSLSMAAIFHIVSLYSSRPFDNVGNCLRISLST